jgi:hypothetical protein
VESVASALAGAIVGGVIGLSSGLLLEHHRWEQARRVAVKSVLLEVSFLAKTLESAAKERVRTRESLQRGWWDRLGPDLVNYLPVHLVNALHWLYYDLDRVQHFYSDFVRQGDAKGIKEEEWPQVAATFLGWAYQAQYVAGRINEYSIRRRRVRLPILGGRSPEEEEQQYIQLMNAAYQQAIEKLRAEGSKVDDTGKVVD